MTEKLRLNLQHFAEGGNQDPEGKDDQQGGDPEG